MNNYFQGPWSKFRENKKNRELFFNASEEKLTFYDLGAAGGIPPPFVFIKDAISVVNFEPDKRSSMEGDFRNLDIAVGPEYLNQIYLNKRPTTSSLLPPQRRITDRYDWEYIFKSKENIFEAIDIQEIETISLDKAVESFDLPNPDFIKIDVQGLSYEVLEGGKNTIDQSVLGIEIEVEFLESYKGQKTFGYIHEYLYKLGFEIFSLKNLNKWYYRTENELKFKNGQHTFCDFVYFRNMDSISSSSEFWNHKKAAKMIQLLLLYDLNDSACAFAEKFVHENIISEEIFTNFMNIIKKWTKSLDFFFDNRNDSLQSE